MRFKEWILSELFNSPGQIDWELKSPNDWVGSFDINGKNYVIKMMKFDIGFGKKENMPWEIKFELMQNGKGTQEITGTGDSLPVFSTVLDGIQQWLSEVKPKNFMLTAREPNRISLYRRLIRMLPPQEWKAEETGGTFSAKKRKTPTF